VGTAVEAPGAIKPCVMVVEDEESLSTLLQYNLDKEGYRVSLAADGEEALIMIDEKQPDIIILDWMLPTVSGIEVCRRLRQRLRSRAQCDPPPAGWRCPTPRRLAESGSA